MDYYAILEVDKTATRDDIRAAFKRLVLAHHPDRAAINNKINSNSGNSNSGKGGKSNEDFANIREAYELLMDEDKKYVLDRWGDVGVFIYKLFEQQSRQQDDLGSSKGYDEGKEESGQTGKIGHKEEGRIRDQIDALLSWYGIRLHSFLIGIAMFSLAFFTIAWGFQVMTAIHGYFLVFSNALIQFLALLQSRRDALSMVILSVLFGLFDLWQYLLWQRFNFLCTILPIVIIGQIIGALAVGVSSWHQPLAISLATLFLCLRWNGFLVLPYPAIFLPILLSRLACTKINATNGDYKKLLVVFGVYLACSAFMHMPNWVISIPFILVFIIIGLFLSVAVPLGHYFIIRLIMEHLKERRPHVAGYIK